MKIKTVVMNVTQLCTRLKIPFFRKFLRVSVSAVAVDVLFLRCYLQLLHCIDMLFIQMVKMQCLTRISALLE